ncbi:hypothetical protein METBIDRAFT_105591 [Metschnikowia bicuspidata var. bicuspidata NRRL YB-4993]|uniref:Uncharacterized protein n=1 Tax=Metschnikowia bicuspidata var. bicuspidata NRRL YB-4993 TaxID=869754 RepID=A0A1A0HHH5_9ASCO|nr:hypothetical protein METBIDRAFT_105591 [Metschnikowia bicuspidata var. bicuspidata NRRL YB-4993]OBA23455.1 hypothetical protein METBIDRAFT_105591 [Metschnikowia bicuspidata var. bicuspidata NRRL YB-4993]
MIINQAEMAPGNSGIFRSESYRLALMTLLRCHYEISLIRYFCFGYASSQYLYPLVFLYSALSYAGCIVVRFPVDANAGIMKSRHSVDLVTPIVNATRMHNSKTVWKQGNCLTFRKSL